MPLTQRIIMVIGIVGLTIAVLPLIAPNRCGQIGLRAGLRSKSEIHTSAGAGQVRTVDEQQAERTCIGDSRRSLAIDAVAVPVLGTLLVALVAVPAVNRRAWRAARFPSRNTGRHLP